MKIVIDSVFFERPLSGISKMWLWYLSNNMFECAGDEVVLFKRQNSSPIISSCWPAQKTIEIPSFHYQTMNQDVEMLNELLIREKCDLFISTYYTFSTKVPCLLWIHDLIPELGFLGIDLNTEPMWVQKRKAIENAAAIVCVSDTTKSYLFQCYPNISFVSVPNSRLASCLHISSIITSSTLETEKVCPVYVLRTPACIDKCRPCEPLRTPHYAVAIVSNADPYKNLHLLLYYADLYQNDDNACKLILIHRGPQRRDKIINSLSNVSEPMLEEIIQKSTAVIIPSLIEGFGLPYIEAAKFGKPVVSLKTSLVNLEVQQLSAPKTGEFSTVNNLVHLIGNSPTELYDVLNSIKQKTTSPNSFESSCNEFLGNLSIRKTTIGLSHILNHVFRCLQY